VGGSEGVRFPDVPDGAWFGEAVTALSSMGVIMGYPDGEFKPGTGISRAEFIAMTVRFAEGVSAGRFTIPINYGVISKAKEPRRNSANFFADVPDTHWAFDSITIAYNNGWIIGYSDKRLAPDEIITRAEAVTILNRALSRYPDKVYIDGSDSIPHFKDVPVTHWGFYEITEAYHPHNYRSYATYEEWL